MNRKKNGKREREEGERKKAFQILSFLYSLHFSLYGRHFILNIGMKTRKKKKKNCGTFQEIPNYIQRK